MMMVPMLGACSMYQEGHITDKRVGVEQTSFSERHALSEINAGYLGALGQYYGRYGDGPVDLTLAYDPESSTNTAMHAGQAMAGLVQDLRKNGVGNVRTSIVPVRDLGEEAQVLISFDAYSAKPPEDCETMPGYDDREIEAEESYDLGCTLETAFSRQIYRPKDLKGQEQTDELTDGRRSSNTVETYRTGVPNEPLGGESSSGD